MSDGTHIYSKNKNIEFKEIKDEIPYGFWESFSAFSNSHGGTIILGIKGQKGVFESVTGVPSAEKTVSELIKELHDEQKISSCHLTDRDITIEERDGKDIIIVNVPEADRSLKPVFIWGNRDSGTFVRVGYENRHCGWMLQREMERESRGTPSDSEVLGDIPMYAINQDTVKRYRARFANRNPDSQYNNLDNVEFLKMIGAVGTVGKEPHPTGAGALMFCDYVYIAKRYPQFFMDFRVYDSDGPRWSDRICSLRLGNADNVFDFYETVIKKGLDDHLPRYLTFDSTDEKVSSDLVRDAIREFNANAVLHADYLGEVGIVVELRPGFISISNPGQFRVSIPKARAGNAGNPRNPTLFRMFSLIGAVDGAGMGILRSVTELAESGLVEPIIIEDTKPSRTTVRIPFARRTGDIETMIIDIINKDSGKSIDEISDIAGIPRSTVYRKIQKLSDSGQIVRCGAKKNGYWKVNKDKE